MAGVFKQIDSRDDFQREIDRARVWCANLLKSGNDETLQSVDMQLEFMQGLLRSGREPTKEERKSIDMGYRMHRAWEEIHDDMDLLNFKNLISLLNMYIRFWPSDKLASDPKNKKKIDWYGD